MELYRAQLEDQLDPLKHITKQMDDQIRLAHMLGDERNVESQMLQITEQLKRQGIRTTEEQNKGLREQLKLLQEADKLGAAKENMIGQSRGKRDENFNINTKALKELQDAGKVGPGSADQFNIINSLMGGTLKDTQEAFDAQIAQFQEYYGRVKELRDADVIDAQQASDFTKEIKRQEMEFQIQRVQTGLEAISGLMRSHNKTAFKIGQAAAIANATITGIQTAMNAYESASKIPYVGWILGPLAAAGAAAATAAQISQIRSQQPPAYRTGGSYTVGGFGGTDSQTVAFRATPGEKVSINTPAQARAMERMGEMANDRASSTQVTQNVTIVQQGKPDRRTSMQQARDMRRETQRQYERSV